MNKLFNKILKDAKSIIERSKEFPGMEYEKEMDEYVISYIDNELQITPFKNETGTFIKIRSLGKSKQFILDSLEYIKDENIKKDSIDEDESYFYYKDYEGELISVDGNSFGDFQSCGDIDMVCFYDDDKPVFIVSQMWKSENKITDEFIKEIIELF